MLENAALLSDLGKLLLERVARCLARLRRWWGERDLLCLEVAKGTFVGQRVLLSIAHLLRQLLLQLLDTVLMPCEQRKWSERSRPGKVGDLILSRQLHQVSAIFQHPNVVGRPFPVDLLNHLAATLRDNPENYLHKDKDLHYPKALRQLLVFFGNVSTRILAKAPPLAQNQ